MNRLGKRSCYVIDSKTKKKDTWFAYSFKISILSTSFLSTHYVPGTVLGHDNLASEQSSEGLGNYNVLDSHWNSLEVKRSWFVSIVITDLWSEHFSEVGGEYLLITVVCHPSSACQVGWGWCGVPRGQLILLKWWCPPVPFLVPGPLHELVFWSSAAQKHPKRFPFYIMELFLSSSSVTTCSFCHKNTVTSAAGKKVGWSLTKGNGETCL